MEEITWDTCVYARITLKQILNKYVMLLFGFVSWNSVVGTATGYRLDDRGVEFRGLVGSRICSSPRRPDRHWGPPNLLPNGYRELFPRG
jgi:hypothetical protein